MTTFGAVATASVAAVALDGATDAASAGRPRAGAAARTAANATASGARRRIAGTRTPVNNECSPSVPAAAPRLNEQSVPDPARRSSDRGKQGCGLGGLAPVAGPQRAPRACQRGLCVAPGASDAQGWSASGSVPPDVASHG